MKYKMLIILFCIFNLQIIVAGEDYKDIWKEQIHNNPHPRVLDDFEIIEMVLFKAVKGISPRDAALASIMFKQAGTGAMRGPIGDECMLSYARELKGRLLSVKERKRISNLHKKGLMAHAWLHPDKNPNAMKMDITFGIRDARALSRTIDSAKTIQKGLENIAKYNGYTTIMETGRKKTFEWYKTAIDMGCPVLLCSEKDEWRLCFGYCYVTGKPYLILSVPENTPFQFREPKFCKEDMESLLPEVIILRKAEKNVKIRTDYEVSIQKCIGGKGFNIEPFKMGKHQAYVFHDWRKSAAIYKKEICAILGLDENKLNAQKEITSKKIKDPNERLWDQYVFNEQIMVSGNYAIVQVRLIPASDALDLKQACLVSSILSTQGSEVSECAFSLKKVYREACKLLNDNYLIPTDERKKEMQALADTVQKAYADQQKKAEDKSDKEKKIDDPFIQAALRIRNTISPTPNLKKALAEIERLHGWKAVLETSKNLPLEEYREAVHKRIPIILKDNKTSKWLLCIGYLKHNGKDKLIITDPSLVDEGKSLHIDNQRLYPGACVYFEDFDPKKYTPYFIHNWHISVERYKDQIAEIFKEEKKADK